jgi:hypothetical protein
MLIQQGLDGGVLYTVLGIFGNAKASGLVTDRRGFRYGTCGAFKGRMAIRSICVEGT